MKIGPAVFKTVRRGVFMRRWIFLYCCCCLGISLQLSFGTRFIFVLLKVFIHVGILFAWWELSLNMGVGLYYQSWLTNNGMELHTEWIVQQNGTLDLILVHEKSTTFWCFCLSGSWSRNREWNSPSTYTAAASVFRQSQYFASRWLIRCRYFVYHFGTCYNQENCRYMGFSSSMNRIVTLLEITLQRIWTEDRQESCLQIIFKVNWLTISL